MKNRLYLFCLCLFIYHLNYAQQFNAGITTGLSASAINGFGNGHFHKVGFIVGGLVNSKINDKNTAQFEINYIRKGSSQPPDSNNNGYYNVTLDYIEIPVLIRRKINFTIRKKPVDRFEFEYGASAGKLLRHTSVVNNYNIPSENKYYNPIDVSLLAGFNYKLGKSAYFSIRYSNGLIPAIKRNSPNLQFITYTYNNGNSMVLQFSLKFIFNGRKDEPVTVPVKTEEDPDAN